MSGRATSRYDVILVAVCGAAAVLAVLLSSAQSAALAPPAIIWTAQERQAIAALSLSSLPPLPPDPSNAFASNPEAAKLGEKLFFDVRFSSNGQVSCSSCHDPARGFTDGRVRSLGLSQTARNSMSVTGSAYSPWLFWDGRADSQWAQALKPLENSVEHGNNRLRLVRTILTAYPREYQALFGAPPRLKGLPQDAGPVENAAQKAAWNRLNAAQRQGVTRAFVNIGKAIAAYERTLLPTETRFDRFAVTLTKGSKTAQRLTPNGLTPDEAQGLKLFIGPAGCTSCHGGPLLTNNDFHNTGVPRVLSLPTDQGRAHGVKIALTDEVNCLSKFSDAKPDDCGELQFANSTGKELLGAFRVPSLRNVARTGPYMDAGQYNTLEQVLNHYNRAPKAQVGRTELRPLQATPTQLRQLEAFLKTLTEIKPRSSPKP